MLSDISSVQGDTNHIEYLSVPESESAMFSRERENKDFFHTMWHSSTHLLAYALESYYGDKVKLLHGPPGDGIPYCFFYEVTLDVGTFITFMSILGSRSHRSRFKANPKNHQFPSEKEVFVRASRGRQLLVMINR